MSRGRRRRRTHGWPASWLINAALNDAFASLLLDLMMPTSPWLLCSPHATDHYNNVFGAPEWVYCRRLPIPHFSLRANLRSQSVLPPNVVLRPWSIPAGVPLSTALQPPSSAGVVHVIVYPIFLSLSAESASYSAVFFSHNKSDNNTFCHIIIVMSSLLGLNSGSWPIC